MLLITGGGGGVVWCGGAVRHVQRADSYHVRYEAIRSRYDTIVTRDTVLYSTVRTAQCGRLRATRIRKNIA